jgi:hypothetical protein
LRLIAVMFLEPTPTAEPRRVLLPAAIAGAACAVGAVLLFVAPQPLWEAASRFLP